MQRCAVRRNHRKRSLLSYGVKTLTGIVDIIQMLNRFGHGVSYFQLEENDTALCLQKLAPNLNQATILPGTIHPNVFTNLAWDNIDRLEETLIGMASLFNQWSMGHICHVLSSLPP